LVENGAVNTKDGKLSKKQLMKKNDDGKLKNQKKDKK